MPILRRKNALQAEISTFKSKGKMNKDKLRQLQILEQSLQAVVSQKQQFQTQLIEIESALIELEKSNTSYKIIGNIMVASKKDDLKKELTEKKDVFSARVKMLDKQEEKLKTEAEKLQKELMKDMKE